MADTIKGKLQEAGNAVGEAAKKVGNKVAEKAEEAKDAGRRRSSTKSENRARRGRGQGPKRGGGSEKPTPRRRATTAVAANHSNRNLNSVQADRPANRSGLACFVTLSLPPGAHVMFPLASVRTPHFDFPVAFTHRLQLPLSQHIRGLVSRRRSSLIAHRSGAQCPAASAYSVSVAPHISGVVSCSLVGYSVARLSSPRRFFAFSQLRDQEPRDQPNQPTRPPSTAASNWA